MMPNTLISHVPTGNDIVDALLSGRKWQQNALTFSFPSSGHYFVDGNISNYYTLFAGQLHPLWQTFVRDIYAKISAVTPFTFTEIAETDTAHAAVRFGLYDGGGRTALAPAGGQHAEVWITSRANLAPSYEDDWYYNLMHEVLHSLGLKHPFEAGGPRGEFPPGQAWQALPDYTVTAYPKTYAQAPGLQRGDIAALQALYGANFDTYAGQTTYTVHPDGKLSASEWMPSTGTALSVISDATLPFLWQTLWDGGGNDSYHFAQLKGHLKVDLRPGQGSVVMDSKQAPIENGPLGPTKWAANIYNPYLYDHDPRSMIENVTTGSGNDIIVANKASNVITGGDGYDVVFIDSRFSENLIKVTVYSDTGPLRATFSQPGKASPPPLTIVDHEGDAFGFALTVDGPEGSDTLRGVEEIWFQDKVVYLDFSPRQFGMIAASHVAGDTFDGDWWQMPPGQPYRHPDDWL